MKKYLYTIATVIAIIVSPYLAQALSIPLNRTIKGAEQLFYPTDSLLVGSSSTTTTSTFEVSGNVGITGTATSTLVGPLSIAGYTIGTTTTVCLYPEHCTYQVASSSANANVQIQAANDALNGMGGGTLLIKRGTYTVASGVSINLSSNVTLTGEGNATTLVRVATSTSLVMISGVQNVSVQNIHLMDSTNLYPLGINGLALIQIMNSSNVKVNNDTLNTNGFGLYIPSTVGFSTTGIVISNNYITTTGHQDAIGGGPNATGGQTSAQDIVVTGNIILVNTPSGGTLNGTTDANCFDMVQTMRIVVSNNVCHGRIVLGSEKYPNSYTEVTGNILDATDGAGLYAGNIVVDQSTTVSGYVPTNLSITNNVLRNGNITVLGSSGASVSHLVLTGNNITGSPLAYSSDNTNGITLTYVTDGLVGFNNLTASTTSLTGILATNTTNTDFAHNAIRDYGTGLNLNGGSGNNSEFNTFDNVTTHYSNISGYINEKPNGSFGLNCEFDVKLCISSDGSNLYVGNLFIMDTNTESTSTGARIALGGVYTGSTQQAFGTIAGLKLNSVDNDYSGYLAFSTRSNGSTMNEVGRFDNLGRFGIGTTTPQSMLQVTKGANATTTVTVGELGLSTSKGCVNMNTNTGAAASFYIVGTTLKVEANYCR